MKDRLSWPEVKGREVKSQSPEADMRLLFLPKWEKIRTRCKAAVRKTEEVEMILLFLVVGDKIRYTGNSVGDASSQRGDGSSLVG